MDESEVRMSRSSVSKSRKGEKRKGRAGSVVLRRRRSVKGKLEFSQELLDVEVLQTDDSSLSGLGGRFKIATWSP